MTLASGVMPPAPTPMVTCWVMPLGSTCQTQVSLEGDVASLGVVVVVVVVVPRHNCNEFFHVVIAAERLFFLLLLVLLLVYLF